MVTALRQRYDAAKFETAAGLLSTGLTLKMTRLKAQASTVEGQQAMQHYAMTLSRSRFVRINKGPGEK